MLIACFLLWKIIMRLSTFCDYSYHIKPSMYHISKRGCKVRGNCWGNRGPWLTSAYWTINQLGAIFLSTNACTWNPYHIPASCCMLHGLTSAASDDVCRGNYDVTGGETSATSLLAAHASHRCARLFVLVPLHVINLEHGRQ